MSRLLDAIATAMGFVDPVAGTPSPCNTSDTSNRPFVDPKTVRTGRGPGMPEPASALLDATTITDWDSFHSVSQQAFGFPDFYGRNMDAWHDCLTYLDDGMSRFDLAGDETLTIVVRGAHDFAQRCPEIAFALTEAVAFVNHSNLEVGAPARLLLLLA